MLILSRFAQAQNVDLKRSLLRTPNLSLQYINYENGLISYQVNAGLPPLFFGKDKKYFLVLNNSFSQTELAPKNTNNRIDFNKFSIVPIFRMKLNSKWSFMSVLPFSFAQEEGSSFFNNRALSLIGIAGWNKNLSPSGSNYGFGIVLIKLAEKSMIFPNFSYQHISKELNWAFRFGFPRISIEKIYDKFILGGFASINFDTFLLNKNSQITSNPLATYLNSQKILLGTRLHFKSFHKLFMDLETGIVLNERLFLSDDQRDRVPGTNFNRQGFESYFTNFNLGYKF
jgi:hypothetical protein